ncbi:MAG TPA: ABC transporter substrate-binding protein [Micromonosporaceae bacterium]
MNMSGTLRHTALVLTLLAVTALTGCADAVRADSSGAGPVKVRLGYFPNLTHATAIVGVEQGIFAEHLGNTATLEAKTFNAGPEAVTALFSGAIDAAYLGPNPAINAWAQSRGQAVRIVAGAASGGAFLVTRPGIDKPEDLRGTTIASPQLGNTQDVALRYWLREAGLATTRDGGGDVRVKPQDNAVTVDTFRSGLIDGAWVPEPTASRLVAAGGRVLVDERDLWPGGRFVTTHLLVSTGFLTKHRDVVRALVAGSVAANAFINADPARAQALVSTGIGKLTGKPLDLALIQAAWPALTFLDDPLASSLRASAAHAEAVDLLKPVKLDGIHDLSLLDEVLAANGKAQVGR